MKPWLNMIWVVLAAIGGYMAANKNINNNSSAPAPKIIAADFGEMVNDANWAVPKEGSGFLARFLQLFYKNKYIDL